MLRTAQSLPLQGLLTLGFDPARFQTEPPACYRASWQLPGPDSHRQATTSLRTIDHLHKVTSSSAHVLGLVLSGRRVDIDGLRPGLANSTRSRGLPMPAPRRTGPGAGS